MNKCAIITAIVIVLLLILNNQQEKFQHENEKCGCQQCDSMRCPSGQPANFPLGSNQLIGKIYKPFAGPLDTGYDFPPSRSKCPRAFTAIYDSDPYLQYFGKSS